RPLPRHLDRARPGHADRRSPLPGEGRAHPRGARLTMWSGFPLFPEQASTMAGRVDALYIALLALGAFFSVLIACLVVGFAIKFRRRSPGEIGTPVHGNFALEA